MHACGKLLSLFEIECILGHIVEVLDQYVYVLQPSRAKPLYRIHRLPLRAAASECANSKQILFSMTCDKRNGNAPDDNKVGKIAFSCRSNQG